MSMKRTVLIVFLVGTIVVVSANAQPLSGTWRFCNGAEFPGASGAVEVTESASGEQCVTLRYDFSGGGAYVAAYCELVAPKQLDRVHLLMNKPPEATITVRLVDASGQTFQKSVYYDQIGFRELAFNMRGWSGFWGGPNDGVLRQPVHTIGILVEKQGLGKEQGTITFTGLKHVETGESENNQVTVVSVQGVNPYLVTDFGEDCVLAKSLGDALQNNTWHINFSTASTAAMGGSLSLFHRPSSLTIRAQASAPGAKLVVDMGAHFQGFKREVGVFDGTEQTFTFTLPPEGWEAYGAAHETLHYPLRIVQIAVERHECKEEQIEVRLHNITCETAFEHTRAVVLKSELRALDADSDVRKFEVACSGWNLLDASAEGTLVLDVKNWDGVVVHTAEMPFTLPGGGKRESILYRFEVPVALRYIDAHFRFVTPGQQIAEALSTFTASLTEEAFSEVLPAPVQGLQIESPWGMGVYLYRNGHNPAGLAEMDRIAAFAAEAGVKWSREEFQLARIETAPGVYDFSFYDELMDAAHRHGISVYALLAYWPPFVEPYTEEGIEAFCNFTRATVRHYKDRIKHWEIYNEPNIFFWEGPKELYPVLLERCYKIVKEEDPEAEVLGISTAGIDRGFIRQVLDAGAPFDALTVHPYRSQFIERNFIRELERASSLVDGRPVWITEMGWSTQIGEGGKTEREQAQLLARAYLSAVVAGTRNMGWYNFRNDGTDPFYNEVNFGVLHRDLTPKAAYRALATVCRTLAPSADAYPEPLENGMGENGVYALAAGQNAAIWSPHSDADVTIATDIAAPVVFNLMGEPVEYSREIGMTSPPVQTGCRSVANVATYNGEFVQVLHLQQGDPLFVLNSNVSIVRVDAIEAKEDALLF